MSKGVSLDKAEQELFRRNPELKEEYHKLDFLHLSLEQELKLLDLPVVETVIAYAKGAYQFIESQYGKRCPDYDENCFICQHWDAYDEWIKGDAKEKNGE